MLHSRPPDEGDFPSSKRSDNDTRNRSGRPFDSPDHSALENNRFNPNQLNEISREKISGQHSDARLHDQDLSQLFAGYLVNKNSVNQNAELAGKLTFYSNSAGAKLYAQEILGHATPSQRAELIAHALFPESPRLADLYLRSRSPNALLSTNQAVELYVNEVFGSDVELKGHAAFRLRWARTQLENLNTSLPDRADAIRAVVRLELRQGVGRISSDASLAKLLGTTLREVTAAVDPYESGLTEQEARQRQAILSVMEKSESQILGRLVAAAIGTLIRIENSLHSEGIIKKLSSDQKIAELFGLDASVVQQYVRLVPDVVQDYRREVFGHNVPEQRKAAMVSSVLMELDHFRHGMNGERATRFRTTIELSKEFKLSPISVFKHLREELPFLDWYARDEQLKHQSGATEVERIKGPVLEYVRQKIDDHRAKRTSRVQSWEELSTIFQVPESTLVEVLNQLDPSEATYRLEHIQFPGFSSRLTSQRSIMTGFVKEELKAYLNQEISTLSNDRELSTLFPIGPLEIKEHLRDPQFGLKLEEMRVRNFVLACSSDTQVSDRAFEAVIVDTLRTRVRRELRVFKSSDHANQNQTKEIRSGVEAIKDRPRGSIHHAGRVYDSIEEASYAHFLKDYCGLTVVPGVTHQIRIGRNEFDFKLGECLVECHSILPFKLKSGLGDFKNAQEYQRYRELREEFRDDPELRKVYLEEIKHLLSAQYRESRQAIVRASPEHRKSELVVVTSPVEFYHMVLKRFATDPDSLPSLRTFLKEFDSVKAAVKQANPDSRGRYVKAKRKRDKD